MGKNFIIDTAVCICKFGTAPGRLKVNSHQLVTLNHGDKKMATSNELQNTFYPPAFGSCTRNSPFTHPCEPVIVRWSNVYKGMRLPGNAYPLMPDSKATCAASGVECIEITFHGQIDIPIPPHMKNATAEHLADLDPAGIYEEEDFSGTAILVKNEITS
jgi:hypothetical protein